MTSSFVTCRSLFVALAAVVFLALLAGCGKKESEHRIDSVDNPLLAYVPADAPYLSANLQPVADEVIDRYLTRAQPVLQALQTQLTAARERLEAGATAAGPLTPLVLALIQELDGKLDRPGMESLGLDLQAPHAFYGQGVFPVYRMGLADSGRLRATVRRVLHRSGLTLPEREWHGTHFWRVPFQSDDHQEPVAALYVAILDDQFAAALFPTSLEGELLDPLLGPAPNRPAEAAARLQAVNQRFGYTPYGSGEVDLLRLAEGLMSADSTAGRALQNLGVDLPSRLPEVCRTEIRQILEHAPRVYSGLTELTADAIAYRLVVETDPALAGELTPLVSTDVPAANPASARALEFALGLRVGAVRDFLRDKARAIAQSPYQCGLLEALDAAAAKAFARLDQPVPPLVNNFRGLRFSIDRVGADPAAPEGVEGVAAVHVEQPEMFVGMAQMFLPDLASLQLTRGGPPVQLPATLVPLPGAVAYAALGNTAIGLALGASQRDRLVPFLAEEADAGGTFLSLNYDTQRYLEYADRFAGAVAEREDDPRPPLEGPLHDLADAIRMAYRAMAGRTDTRAGFSADGIILDSRMTFQPAPKPE